MPGNGAHDSLINCGRVTCQNLSEIADMRWGNAVFAESTVSRASGSDFESLLLIGSADIDGTGTALADALTGVTTLDADDLML